MKRLAYSTVLLILTVFFSCQDRPQQQESTETETTEEVTTGKEVGAEGVRMIDVETHAGTFKVWTKRVGDHPTIKALILHGGPGGTHEYLEAFDDWFPDAGIEYYHYDQLGSYHSDQPTDTTLWTNERFVEEVEQVRIALGLNKDNFYLIGHSWGGILAIDYALKYQENIKGLVISNMMSSAPEYHKYAHTVLGPGLGEEIYEKIKTFEAAGDYSNEEYIEIIENHHYPKHVLRRPMKDWPEPVLRSFSHFNTDIYVRMQGPSEFGMAGNPSLKTWDQSGNLSKITVPTLCIGAQYDTMDPEHMKWMSKQFPNGRYLHCPDGSHLAPYDDSEVYFEGLISFLKEVDDNSEL